jgi:predicted alpha/beta-fold hydrolase
LILTAQDDPFVPFESFSASALAGNAFITLVAPEHGGHCAFISRHTGESRFWGELQVMTFGARLVAAADNGSSVEELRQQ